MKTYTFRISEEPPYGFFFEGDEPEVGAELVLLEDHIAVMDAKEGVINMTVDRLGGMVEGAPTYRVNFLQRIDELRRIESRGLNERAMLVEWLRSWALDYRTEGSSCGNTVAGALERAADLAEKGEHTRKEGRS